MNNLKVVKKGLKKLTGTMMKVSKKAMNELFALRNRMKLPQELKGSDGLHITLAHTGKMAGMQSLSTSCLLNPYCQRYASDPSKICFKCYANTMLKYRASMRPCLERNRELLTERILPIEQLPLLNIAFFRFEAFGDLNSATQVANYFNICNANPFTRFALWTKNPAFIDQAIKMGHDKPENLIILVSSPYINKRADISRWWFVDKVFTVYDKKTIKDSDVDINCGANSCIRCLRCYLDNGITEINEKLK